MPNTDQELEVARLVACYSAKYRDIPLGTPVLNDDGSENLKFDIRFDSAEPRVALEITSIEVFRHIETASVSRSLADELTESALKENLGRWYVEIVAGTKLKSIKRYILKAMRGEQIELPNSIQGITKAEGGEAGVVICTWGSSVSDIKPLTGITPELEKALKNNSQKLGHAHGYERHLAVDLLAQCALNPSSSPVPILPSEVDVLWVVTPCDKMISALSYFLLLFCFVYYCEF